MTKARLSNESKRKKTTAKAKKKADAKKKAKAEPITLNRVVERVKHNFLDDELITFGALVGSKFRELRSVIGDKKAIAADFTAREKALEAEIDEVTGKINAGFEMRGKETFKFYDYKAGVVYWFLCEALENRELDPGKFPDADELLAYLLTDEDFEPVRQRPIRPDERQAKLFEDETAAGGGDGDQDGGDAESKKEPEVVTD